MGKTKEGSVNAETAKARAMAGLCNYLLAEPLAAIYPDVPAATRIT